MTDEPFLEIDVADALHFCFLYCFLELRGSSYVRDSDTADTSFLASFSYTVVLEGLFSGASGLIIAEPLIGLITDATIC